MNSIKTDPLLAGAQGLLWFFIGLLCLAMFFIALGIPMAAFFQEHVVAEAAAKGITAGPELVGAVLIMLVAVLALLSLTLYFVVLLLRIVRSVKDGDPFIAENAERLSRMGWVALATQVVMLPLGAMALWIAEITKDIEGVHVDGGVDISGEGILLVLVLFILARVFRKGTEMRAELEGTV